MAYSSQSGTSILHTDTSHYSLTAFAGFLVTAGLINSLIAAFVFCRQPSSHTPSLSAIFVRALIYVAGTALAGTAGARIYWSRSSSPFKSNPPVTFGRFALTSSTGWVWVPAVVILSRQDSPASAALSAMGAVILGSGLRATLPSDSLRQPSFSTEVESLELFAQSLQTTPRESHAFIIAACLYASSFALYRGSNLVASALLAPCAFLIAWKLTLGPGFTSEGETGNTRAALRLACIAVPAVLVTFMALQLGVASRNQANARGDDSNRNHERSARNASAGISGYESIILWPVPEKKQIIAPIPPHTSLYARGAAKPIVIRFDGPYWYFQAPVKKPGPRSHTAHGNPLAVNIQSNNFRPLAMEAHQHLANAIRLEHCREIQVAIENRDNRHGAIALGVLLTDSASAGEPAVFLGQQPVVSSQPGSFSVKSSPVDESLRFPVPSHAKIRRFDEITVIFLPGIEHYQVSPKIAIQQFEILPH
jgi:hypothetical protein